ncbi:hypothetical protein BH11MYX3_BH11MYX3_41080 [soil metagenome]
MQRITDRTGHVWAELSWEGPGLVDLLELRVPGARIGRALVDHPILGRCAPIASDSGALLTMISAVDWAAPSEIPAIAAPGRLPPGAGGVILNVLAILAGTRTLRYAGPYPTSALYQSLLRSFTTTATEAAFTVDALGRALRGARDVMPFEFVPAPHERVAFARGHAELRDGLERVVIDGIGYARDGSPARLVDRRAEIWFGDAPWAEVATFTADGSLIAGPHPLPACTSAVIGKEFPPPLREAIAELIAEVVPAPLAADARALVVRGPLRWADLGARAARRTPSGPRSSAGFEVHAALWDRLAASGLARVALALAEALAPVVANAVVAEVAERVMMKP